METITVISELVQSIGFPIAMCILLFMQMNKQTEKHSEETKVLADSLNNNTTALSEFRITVQEMLATKEKE